MKTATIAKTAQEVNPSDNREDNSWDMCIQY